MKGIIEEDVANFIAKEKIDWTYFCGCNILITGACGMLGSYLTQTLLLLMERGWIRDSRIYALCRNREKAERRFRSCAGGERLVFLFQDVCDPLAIGSKIDIVIHMASQASPKYYGTDPAGTVSPNVIGTWRLLEFARKNQVKDFVFFSSAEVYGKPGSSGAVAENAFGPLDPLPARSCYAESKRMGETLCISWYRQYGVPVKIVRPFHTYGPGMSLDDGRVFADFVSNIVKGENIEMKSEGKARRAFCYLSDAVGAYLYILSAGRAGEAYNVGNPAEEYSIAELADILVNLFPEKGLGVIKEQERRNPLQASPADRFLPDIRKTEHLGWVPKIDVRTGFYRTVLSFIREKEN